jgi:3-oxoacyl-[acyl-carrier-protein] synthase II
MTDAPRETWITGIGIVSCLGEGRDAHWQTLNAPPPPANTTSWPGQLVHSLPRVELDKQIPKKGDQRQMEPWQRIGTYAAGLALDDAGVKGNASLLAGMDMIVAAGGGERDEAVDASIMTGMRKSNNPAAFLNERLMSDLRPTLFLAQLSNLLAGNISIVHGVTGSSRTFMGEEAAGVDVVRIAHARIIAGQSDISLVGGAYNAEHIGPIVLLSMGKLLWKGQPPPIWTRAAAGGGLLLGSMGAFLVLEEKSHALRRAAKPLARISAVLSRHDKRAPGAVARSLEWAWADIGQRVEARTAAVVSGASGVERATSEEHAFLKAHSDLAVRATGSHLGHGVEAQFTMNIALAAISLTHGRLFATFDPTGFERAHDAPLRQVAVTGVGLWRGEGLALIEAVG